MRRYLAAIALILSLTVSALAQTVPLGPRFVLPFQTVVDSNGTPIPGALLNFYISGTGTRQNTYSDPLLTVPNSNPVVANAAGVFPNIFLSGNYKIVLTDSSGNPIWTADPVYSGFSGNFVGPDISVVNDIAVFNSVTGTLFADSGISLGSQSANLFLATPSAAPGVPSFRTIAGADLPFPSATTLGGIESITSLAHNWIAYIDTSGVPHQSQPAFSDVSGALAPTQLPTTNANTVIGNFTSSSAQDIPTTIPSCPDSTGNHLNYVNGTGITCGSSSVGSAMVLLNTITATSSPTALSDTTSLTASYSSYEIVFYNVVPSASASTLQMQIYSGGAFKTTGYIADMVLSDNGTASAETSTTGIFLSGTSIANNASPGVSGTLHIYNPSAASIAAITGTTSTTSSSSLQFVGSTSGFWNTAGAVTGFQFTFGGTVTFSSGIIKIYGII